MNKTKLLILLFTAICCTMMLTSCSDKKEGLLTEKDLEKIRNKDYFVSIDYDNNSEKWEVTFSARNYSVSDIEANLKINGELIIWDCEENEDGEKISYSHNFTHGQTCHLSLTINGVTRTANLKILHEFKITDPTKPFDHADDYTINWTIAKDPMYQGILYNWFTKWNYRRIYDSRDNFNSEIIKPSQRSYTFPANLVSENWLNFGGIIGVANYRESGNVLFISSSGGEFEFENEGFFNTSKANKTRTEKSLERKARIENIIQIINP